MAYAFAAANSRYLSTSAAPASGSPMTIAAWCRPTATGVAVVSVGVSSGSHRNQLVVNPVSGSTVLFGAQAIGATSTGLSQTVTGTSSVWGHIAGVFSSSTSRTGYTNGVASTTDTTNIGTQSAATAITIGARWNTTVGLYFSGDIADVGIWNVALDAAEIASLAKGVACRLVRPQSLVFYAPLIRDLVDEMRGLTITNNNTAAVADHPRIYQ